jgi:hypothetical protein
VVFTDPTEDYYQELLELGNLPPINLKNERAQAAVASYSDEHSFLQLLEAKKFLTRELQQVKSRFLVVEGETKEIDTAMRTLQESIKASRKKPPPRAAVATGAASKKQKS